MAVDVEDLIEGNYYINQNHGICKYKGIHYNNDKKYYVFTFKKEDRLFMEKEKLEDIEELECDKEYAQLKLSELGKFQVWQMKRESILGELDALTKTKKSLLNIENYENILINGIDNDKVIIEQSLENFQSSHEEITGFIEQVLRDSIYPDGYNKIIDVEYETSSQTVIVNYRIPNTDEVPKIIKYKYDVIVKKLNEFKMKDKQFIKYYESVVFQITLRSINEIFSVSEDNEIKSVVFNGWTETIDKKTGIPFVAFIISLMVSRSEFQKINLRQVSFKECVRHLKGVFSGELHQLTPIKPILDINKNDRRFVDSKEVLSELNDSVNIADIGWEDFEHLVRELFEKIFSSDGSEVKVTQASRDGGVDAIAFDNDPIKGGKFIIQAKRYNNVVPVSAVRDLYGTLINEGAIKGILVTTSYFGNDSREFAKDKPIALVDGSNLVYLLNQYGYKAKIELKRK